MEVTTYVPFIDPKLWIIDLDGTLIDTKSANQKVIEVVMQELNQPICQEVIDRNLSVGTVKVLELLLQKHPKLVPKASYLALELYKSEEYLTLLRPYQEMIRLVTHLRKKNKVAIATNRAESTKHILKHHRIEDLFHAVVHRDMVQNGKPHPEMLLFLLNTFRLTESEAIFIGNDWPDMQAGVLAKITTVVLEEKDHKTFVDQVIKKGPRSFFKGAL